MVQLDRSTGRNLLRHRNGTFRALPRRTSSATVVWPRNQQANGPAIAIFFRKASKIL